MADEKVIDLKKTQKDETRALPGVAKLPTVTRFDPYSPEWAKEVKPVAKALLSLLAAVMLLPFVLIYSPTIRVVPPQNTPPGQIADAVRQAAEAASATRTKDMLDWAKTILPSVVGFVSAMVGYYFGTRASQGERAPGQPGEPPVPPAQPPAPPGEPPAPPEGKP